MPFVKLGFPPSRPRWAVVAALGGVACFIVSTVPLALYYFLQFRFGATFDFSQAPEPPRLDLIRLLVVRVLVVPPVENILFLIIHYPIFRVVLDRRQAQLAFIVILAALSFVLHGAGIDDIGKGVAFGLIAALYALAVERFGWAYALTLIWITHASWNLLTVIGVMIFQG